MTKSTITRARLQELAAGQSGFNLRTATHEEYQELARITLAAIDSEPVAENIRIADALEGLLWPNMELGNKAVIQAAIEALRTYHAQPATECEHLAIENFRSAMEGIGHIRRTLEETFGGLHGTHVEPDVLMDCKTICDAIYAAYSGNSPVIPDGLIAAVNRLLDSDGSRGCYSAIRCYDARAEVERLLAAAPQEEKP